MALVRMRAASRGILTVLLVANGSFEKNKINLASFSDSLMQVYYPCVRMFGCITEANSSDLPLFYSIFPCLWRIMFRPKKVSYSKALVKITK